MVGILNMKKFLNRSNLYVYIVSLSLIVILTIMYLVSRNMMIQEQLHLLISDRDVTVAKIEDEFNQLSSIIMDVDSYIVSQSNLDELLLYLEDIDENNEDISSIYFGTPDNTMINSSGFVPPPTFDLTTRPWYISAIASDTVIFTNAFINATEDRVIVTVSYAVYNNDLLLGVIGADIDIRNITSYVNFVDQSDGFGFLIDGNSVMIAHPDLNPTTISLQLANSFGIDSGFVTSDAGISSELEVQDVKGRIAYSDICGTDFYFGLFMPNSVLQQNLKIFTYISFAFVVAIIAVVGSALYIYRRYIQQPALRLTEDIKKISSENNYNYRFEVKRGVGFLEARQAFNNLLDETINYQHQAVQHSEELLLRNQKYNLLLDSAMDIVFEMDDQFRYVEVYGRGLQLFNLKEKDMIGKTFKEIFGSNLGDEREKHLQNALKGLKSVYSWKYTNNGEDVYLETVVSPLYDAENEIMGIVGVTRDITEQEIRYNEMVHTSNHDYLTGLYNRRYYIQMLEELDSKRVYPFSVINIDFNGLKIINDAYGHAAGDQALIRTAELLLENSPKDYIVSRVSGDEFTIIMPKSDKQTTDIFISDLNKRFSNEYIGNIELSIAIGYYVKHDSSIDVDEVRKLAENDMFRHKITERKSVKNKAISAILKTLTEKYEAERIHSNRVSEISVQIGEALNLTNEELKELKIAAMFHDIGKISIPDDIINKPGKLTPDEYDILKSHTEVGYEILRAADEYSQLAIHASSHHERYDGKGYPNGLVGNQIPYFSRIIAIADSYEAMTSDRPYRSRMSDDYAADEIVRYAGTQFDPELARVFVELVLKREFVIKEKKKG